MSRIFFSLTLVFVSWSVLDLVTWLNHDTRMVMSAWSLTGVLETLFFLLTLYFLYVFVNKKDAPFLYKALSAVSLFPLLILMPTTLNLTEFDVNWCYPLESNFSLYYKYAVEILSVLLIIIFSIIKIRQTKDRSLRKQIVVLFVGIMLFLSSFFVAVFLGGYLTDNGMVTGYGVEIYGLFGVVVFMGFLAYLIVKFSAFHIKLLGVQALVYSQIILIGSQFFFVRNQINMILTGVTVAGSIILGYFLILGVKREIQHREEIQRLAANLAETNENLEVANEKLKALDKQKTEFVSLASHQLRSPITAIKGYSSMLLEGSFGKIPEKAKEAVGRVFESSQKLVLVIEDFLNITRIELGRIKYDITEFSLNTLAKNVIGEQKPNIERRGLSVSYEEDVSEYKVYADLGKISQVISNLVDNSVKYCPKGSIQVKVGGLEVGGVKKVRLSVTDTGVGIDPKVMPHLFQKFTRADDASDTNIIGTGLGLFVAKQIVDAHPGARIWAESEGKGKGSTFFVELAVSTGVAPVMIIPSSAEGEVSTAKTVEVVSPLPINEGVEVVA